MIKGLLGGGLDAQHLDIGFFLSLDLGRFGFQRALGLDKEIVVFFQSRNETVLEDQSIVGLWVLSQLRPRTTEHDPSKEAIKNSVRK